jgi:hypothetical protein
MPAISSVVSNRAFFGMPHLNRNVLCAIDIIASSENIEDAQLLEVSVLPLDHMLRPHKEFLMFNMKMKPEGEVDYAKCKMLKEDYVKCILNGHDMYKAGDLFLDWFKAMELRSNKKIVPLAYNWPYVSGVLRKWITDGIFNDVFDPRYRDVLPMATYLNDRADAIGQEPFYVKQDFYYIANKHRIPSFAYRSSTNDVLILSQLFKEMLLNPPVVT